MSENQIVTPGEIVATEGEYLRGHGTNLKDTRLTASVAGVVQRLNKLITVHPYKTRYRGDVGDIVVGKVVEVANKRWKIDVGARQHSVLMLSAINLPTSEVRRRSALDELNMRKFFTENDYVTAEVQQVFHDGSLALHSRRRYGKLGNGFCAKLHPSLIKRAPTQIISLPELELELVMGRNGVVWIGPLISEEQKNAALQGVGFANRGHYHFHGYSLDIQINGVVKRNMSLVRNILSALNFKFLMVSEQSLRYCLGVVWDLGVEPKDLLKNDVIEKITSGL
ncbi:hypothetical protein P9112_004245 [Eukaryota sp. TZLM1-RC]